MTGAAAEEGTAEHNNSNPHERKCGAHTNCVKGILLPAWQPQGDIDPGIKAGRAIVYIICLIYLFLGVSIIAEKFMEAVEYITSKERTVKVHRQDGTVVEVKVKIWNQTVANLTLIAIGSAAPEILLNIVEIIGYQYTSGELGPSTTVGSAAFNLFIIIGICVLIVPKGQVRRIQQLPVFAVTAGSSIFAYIWMYLIISQISPGIVEVWEAILTLLFFPITVIIAYLVDIKYYVRFLPKKYRGDAGKEMDGIQIDEHGVARGKKDAGEASGLKELELATHEYVAILAEMQQRYPEKGKEELEDLASNEFLNRGTKSVAYYRVQATKGITGGGPLSKKKVNPLFDRSVTNLRPSSGSAIKIYFSQERYTVLENCGEVKLKIKRRGHNKTSKVSLKYHTEDGTAKAGIKYKQTKGTVTFNPGETEKFISVEIIDDDIYMEDQSFTVKLSNLKVENANLTADVGKGTDAELVEPFQATVLILDDDHAGVFNFESSHLNMVESVGEASINVQRLKGAKGKVRVPYKVFDGSARNGGIDFTLNDGELVFENNDIEKAITVQVVNRSEYDREQSFRVSLGEPIPDGKASLVPALQSKSLVPVEGKTETDDGTARLGEPSQILCHIISDQKLMKHVEMLLNEKSKAEQVPEVSWRQQFTEALTISAGESEHEGHEGHGEHKLLDPSERPKPSCVDYTLHYLSLPWKLIFAFVPPAHYLGGWLSLVICILMIGTMTAVVGDLATHLGCTVGLADEVTAIAFVVLGTGVPDTFASKVATLNGEDADCTVGHVTGSTCVNVFLGIGISWSIAAIFHKIKGGKFTVVAGSLGFSVTVFCCCCVACIAILLLRRLPPIGGELGGPRIPRFITAFLLFFLWIFYVIMSTLDIYCHIKGF